MGAPEANLALLRSQMVDLQLRSRGITDQRVLDAFARVPRDIFIPSESRHQAYADRPVPIGCGQTISQPYIVALMIQELHVRPDSRVLDIGAGSGYQTALLAGLAGWVYAIERIDSLTARAEQTLETLGIANVTMRTGDGTLGWPEQAPFDAIVCGAGGPCVPGPWIDQLADGGAIVMPVGGPDIQQLVAVTKSPDKTTTRTLCDCRFVRLIGEAGWPGS